MAQWNGQFSGNTHETKVRDLEDSLRIAVAAARSSSDGGKGKAVERIADRLLSARLKVFRARLSRCEDDDDVPSLMKKIEDLDSQGVQSVLAEFGAPIRE